MLRVCVSVAGASCDVSVAASYLGVGLMAARHSILLTGQQGQNLSVVSDCVNPVVNTKWSYAGKTYNIR